VNYLIDRAIFTRWPTFVRKVIIGNGVSNPASNPDLESEFRSLLTNVAGDADLDVNHPRIAAWQRIYDSFPTNVRVRPSIHTLVRRAKNLQGKPIPFISTLVCISNLVSLKHLVPSGLVDASKVVGDVALGFAQGGERFGAIGSDEIETAMPGEVIYYATGSHDVLCRAWNSRGGRVAATDQSTRRVIVDVDGILDVVSRDELQQAATWLASLVSRYCGGSVRIFELSSSTPEIDIGGN